MKRELKKNRFFEIFFLDDYKKYGMVKNIYQPHGLIWVDGINIGEPVWSQDLFAEFNPLQMYTDPVATHHALPLNYR